MRVSAFIAGLLVLSGCIGNRTDLIETEAEALSLLNSGEVAQIGVSHSGWTMLTLKSGETRSNKMEIIGSPYTLLQKCSECADVAQWIE